MSDASPPEENSLTPGLYIVATPIGNLGDITLRAVDVLRRCDGIACEDTRVTGKLLKHLGISKPMWRYDDHSEHRDRTRLVESMRTRAVALVSDAGMPLINDPGYRLVTACAAAGLTVSCLPGPSAVTTALAVSGLAADRFCFEGFAPRKQVARRSWLSGLATEARTCVFFESPRRLADTLTDAVDTLGADRRAVVCRELTKTHEEIRRGTLAELADWAADGVLGEITVVLAGATPKADLATLVAQVADLVDDGLRVKDACAQVVEANPGAPSKRDLYDAVLRSRD